MIFVKLAKRVYQKMFSEKKIFRKRHLGEGKLRITIGSFTKRRTERRLFNLLKFFALFDMPNK